MVPERVPDRQPDRSRRQEPGDPGCEPGPDRGPSNRMRQSERIFPCLRGTGAGMKYDLGKPWRVEKYGEFREGACTIAIRGVEYRLKQVLARWMMDVPEVWTLDGGELGDDRYWRKFLDAGDRYVVVFEFDGKFDIVAE